MPLWTKNGTETLNSELGWSHEISIFLIQNSKSKDESMVPKA